LAGRTPAEAVQNFLGPLQQAISCVTRTVLVSSGYHPRQDEEPHLLTLGESPARLNSNPRLFLSVTMHYHVVEAPGERGPWKVSIAAYLYSLDDEQGQEILAFHWHPRGRSSVTSPHLHIGPGAGVQYQQLQGAHIPTGRVALEDVLRLAIRELGVRPLRRDWADILDRTQRAFEQWRTWPAPDHPLGP